MRWDSGKGFYVPDLAVKECTSVEDMLEVWDAPLLGYDIAFLVMLMCQGWLSRNTVAVQDMLEVWDIQLQGLQTAVIMLMDVAKSQLCRKQVCRCS